MREVSIRELRQMMGVLDEVLARHGELTITRHGRPIARMVPVPQRASLADCGQTGLRPPRRAPR